MNHHPVNQWVSPAQRALLDQDAAEAAFENYISTGQGDGKALSATLISARAAYLRESVAEHAARS